MDNYLKIDAGELLMCEGIWYSGCVIDDFFHGNGELYLMDSFEIKGKWKKGFLITGQIIFNQLEQYKYFKIEEIKGIKKYTLYKDNSSIKIEDKYDVSWAEGNKQMRMCIQVS